MNAMCCSKLKSGWRKWSIVNEHVTPALLDEQFDKEKLYRKLANINHVENLKNTIPESISFMQLYKAKYTGELDIEKRWKENQSYKNMAVPLGVRGKDDIVHLNLHEKAHGPHGLIAGTTGSGKSEIIQSYILSLAVNFHPHEVAFLLIDYKGGGMANLFKDLPLEGKKEAIQHATKAWYQNQGKKVAQYVDDRMVPVVQKAASHGVDRYNRVADALNKLGVRPQYAYAGIGTDVVKKISKRDMDQYISKAASNIKHKVNPVSAGDQTIDLTKNNGKQLKVGEDDAHLITRVDYTEKEHMMWKNGKALKPNVEYVTPEGHLYRTDDLGRIKYVEVDNLFLKKGKRKPHMQRVAGRIFRRKDDDGGHLIGDQFAGSGDIDNLVPMNSQINRRGGQWYNMEMTWADALKEVPPKQVRVRIEPIYSGESLRPDKFKVKFTVDNKYFEKTIINEKEF